MNHCYNSFRKSQTGIPSPVCDPSKTFLERYFHDVDGEMRLTDGSNDKACRYCRSVWKKRNCTDRQHRQGHEYDPNKGRGKRWMNGCMCIYLEQ